jgi:hypothetical protein
MPFLHDDAAHGHAYGPAQGLTDTKAGTFNRVLHDEAAGRSRIVIPVRSGWNRLFAFAP